MRQCAARRARRVDDFDCGGGDRAPGPGGAPRSRPSSSRRPERWFTTGPRSGSPPRSVASSRRKRRRATASPGPRSSPGSTPGTAKVVATSGAAEPGGRPGQHRRDCHQRPMNARTALVDDALSGELQGEQGYLMVALLVAMSVMAIMMGAALPAWHTLAQREKEAELVFRGEQYARAIGLYQRRFANAPPPSIDVLVEQRFLRKKYKDPITNDEFQVLGAGAALPGQTQSRAGAAQAQGAFSRRGSAGGCSQAAGRRQAGQRAQGRRAMRHRAASLAALSASPARALRSRFASTTAATPTTSGSSCPSHALAVAGAGVVLVVAVMARGADGRGVLDGRGRGPQGDGRARGIRRPRPRAAGRRRATVAEAASGAPRRREDVSSPSSPPA